MRGMPSASLDATLRANPVRNACSSCQTSFVEQAQDKFEQWHAERWLSPRRVLHKAGAELQPVLLPFWLFEAAIKVEYAAQVFLAELQVKLSTELAACTYAYFVPAWHHSQPTGSQN